MKQHPIGKKPSLWWPNTITECPVTDLETTAHFCSLASRGSQSQGRKLSLTLVSDKDFMGLVSCRQEPNQYSLILCAAVAIQ